MTILSALSIALCLGIIVGFLFHPPFLIAALLATLAIIFAGIYLKNNRLFIVFILICSFSLGIVSTLNRSIYFKNDVSQLGLSYSRKVLLRGVISDDPKEYKKPYKHDFILQASSVKIEDEIYKIRGLVLVKAYQRQEFSYGQEIIIRGGLLTPQINFGKGNFNYRLHLKTLGIDKIFYSKKKDYVKFLNSNHIHPVKKLAFSLRHKSLNFILDNFDSPYADILIPLLLGGREYLGKDLNDLFVKTGTVHILAISGLHVGIVAFISLVLLKALNIKFVPRHIIVLALIIFYSILTGLRPSIVRSAVMIGIYIFGLVIERETDIYNCLAVATIAIVVFNPFQLFNIGLQLSFISVFAICYFPAKIEFFIKKITKKEFKGKISYLFFKGALCSASAWLGTWVIVAYYFNIISLITIVANILVVPYSSLLLATGFSFLIMGQFHSILANAFATSSEFVVLVLIKWVGFLSRIPGAYFYVESFSLWWVVAYYIIIIIIFNFNRLFLTRRGRIFSYK